MNEIEIKQKIKEDELLLYNVFGTHFKIHYDFEMGYADYVNIHFNNALTLMLYIDYDEGPTFFKATILTQNGNRHKFELLQVQIYKSEADLHRFLNSIYLKILEEFSSSRFLSNYDKTILIFDFSVRYLFGERLIIEPSKFKDREEIISNKQIYRKFPNHNYIQYNSTDWRYVKTAKIVCHYETPDRVTDEEVNDLHNIIENDLIMNDDFIKKQGNEIKIIKYDRSLVVEMILF